MICFKYVLLKINNRLCIFKFRNFLIVMFFHTGFFSGFWLRPLWQAVLEELSCRICRIRRILIQPIFLFLAYELREAQPNLGEALILLN